MYSRGRDAYPGQVLPGRRLPTRPHAFSLIVHEKTNGTFGSFSTELSPWYLWYEWLWQAAPPGAVGRLQSVCSRRRRDHPERA